MMLRGQARGNTIFKMVIRALNDNFFPYRSPFRALSHISSHLVTGFVV